ncbi:DUF2778 domain-containing protein [Snodgrassella alvi]|uniref:DUF2778 domain-containing protein n=1 Tax=Snodgrassella alvi TaxID=1196083 RepID=UPI001C557170
MCFGIGVFDVFSGVNPTTNIAECAFKNKAALPSGTYGIVPRPEGSFANRVQTFIKDYINGTDHSEWFGLYSNLTMSDHLFVNGVERGGFRLHPLRPNGSGESWGCITFRQYSQFQMLRRALLSTKKVKVKDGVQAYGQIVIRGNTNYANCKIK